MALALVTSFQGEKMNTVSALDEDDGENSNHTCSSTSEEQNRASVLGPSIEHSYIDRSMEGTDDDERESIMKAKTASDYSFPMKLYEMLSATERNGQSDIVGWQPHGRCFIVRDAQRFTEEVLPGMFSQTKFASFQRQLNLYGFKRLTNASDRSGYYHEYFLRGKRSLCHNIKRTKTKGNGFRRRSNPDDEPRFWDMPICGGKATKLKGSSSSAPQSSLPDPEADVQLSTGGGHASSSTDAPTTSDTNSTNGNCIGIHRSGAPDYSAQLGRAYRAATEQQKKSAIQADSNNSGSGCTPSTASTNTNDYTIPLSLTYNAAATLPFRSTTTSNIASVGSSSRVVPGISSFLRTVPNPTMQSSGSTSFNSQQQQQQYNNTVNQHHHGHGAFASLSFERDLVQTSSDDCLPPLNGCSNHHHHDHPPNNHYNDQNNHNPINASKNTTTMGYDELMGFINDRHTHTHTTTATTTATSSSALSGGDSNNIISILPAPPDTNQEAVLDALTAVAPYYNLSQKSQPPS